MGAVRLVGGTVAIAGLLALGAAPAFAHTVPGDSVVTSASAPDQTGDNQVDMPGDNQIEQPDANQTGSQDQTGQVDQPDTNQVDQPDANEVDQPGDNPTGAQDQTGSAPRSPCAGPIVAGDDASRLHAIPSQ